MISILKTIFTTPGNIPEDKEWDMNSDSLGEGTTSEDDSEKQKE